MVPFKMANYFSEWVIKNMKANSHQEILQRLIGVIHRVKQEQQQ
jgi:hypothetical protein